MGGASIDKWVCRFGVSPVNYPDRRLEDKSTSDIRGWACTTLQIVP